jgi:hypothetical protein
LKEKKKEAKKRGKKMLLISVFQNLCCGPTPNSKRVSSQTTWSWRALKTNQVCESHLSVHIADNGGFQKYKTIFLYLLLSCLLLMNEEANQFLS